MEDIPRHSTSKKDNYAKTFPRHDSLIAPYDDAEHCIGTSPYDRLSSRIDMSISRSRQRRHWKITSNMLNTVTTVS